MAEYRSYARQGQFPGRIVAPNTAKAKRREDKEFVKELKEENQALKDRDAKFLQRMQEKLSNEKVYRKAVEDARRYSVEREREAIIANAKAEADNAELERKANKETWDSLSELVPTIVEAAEEVKKRRDKFDKETADAAFRRAGFTPEEVEEYRKINWTAGVLASDKFKSLSDRLAAAQITHKQFIDAVKGKGIWGRSFSAHDVMMRAQSGSGALTKAVEEGWVDSNGIPLGQILTGEVPGNNREGVREWLREWELSTFRDYDPRFVEEIAGKDLARFKNDILASVNEKEQAQALQEYNDGRFIDLRAQLAGGGTLYQDSRAPYTEQEWFKKVQIDARLLAARIESGELSHDSELIDNFLNTRVWNPSLNGGKGGATTARKDTRIAPIIDAARSKRERALIQQSNSMIEAGEIENNELFFHHRQAIEKMPYDEAHNYTNDLLADPNIPHSVKARLNKYIKSTDAQQNYRNNRINKILDQRIKDGIPIDPELINGATGEVYHKGRKLIAEQNSMAVHDKKFKATAKNWIDGVTGRKTDFDKGHDDFPQVSYLLQRRYKELQQIEKRKQGTTGLTDSEIHNKVLLQVEQEWREGTTGDESKRTGTFRYISPGGDPTKGEFTNIYKIGRARIQPKISESHDRLGAGFGSQPGAVFTKAYTANLQEGMHRFTKSDWERGADVARLDPTIDTPAKALVEAMIANGHTPPPALVRAANDRSTLIELSAAFKKPLENAHLLRGEDLYNRDTLLKTAANLSGGKHKVTGEFGWREDHPVYGGRAYHYGIDLAAPMGAQQFNAHVQMRVIDIEYSNGGGHGYTAEFYIGDQRVVMRSLHHQKILAREGQVIPPGGIVALVGSTGGSTGPHMHLEFYIDSKPINPRSVLGGIPLFEYMGPYTYKNQSMEGWT